MGYRTSMEKRELEADPMKKKKKNKKPEREADLKKKSKKRDREADPKRRRKKREREADPKKKSKKRDLEADPKKKIKKREREREREADPKKKKKKDIIIIHDGGDIRDDSTTLPTTTTRKSWEDIPHHLLELFLKPLETAERPNLSRVCKAWGEFKPKPQSSCCFPEIVLGSIFDLIKGDEVDKYRLRSCLGSSHGWLIIRMEKLGGDDGHFSEQLYYLLNLVTKDTIQLPILWNHNPDYPSIFFSSAPTDPDCIVLMFDTSFPGFLFSKRGCNKWIESQCEYPFYSKPPPTTTHTTSNVKKDCLHSTIALGGKFYALSFRGNLVAIDIDVSDDLDHHPTATLTVLPANSIFPNAWGMRIGYDWFLVESLGKLLVVRLYRRKIDLEIIDVDVLELDFETMSWITVKSLPGDQVLFIGLCSSFSISGSGIGISSCSSSSSSGGSNCIYVFDDVLCKISRYNMHNQEMMVCRAFPTSELLYKYGRFWVKPTFV